MAGSIPAAFFMENEAMTIAELVRRLVETWETYGLSPDTLVAVWDNELEDYRTLDTIEIGISGHVDLNLREAPELRAEEVAA